MARKLLQVLCLKQMGREMEYREGHIERRAQSATAAPVGFRRRREDQIERRSPAAVCLIHANERSRQPFVYASDEFVLPVHESLDAQYTTNKYGVKELHLRYGSKEISFDEPELFAFGEALMKQSRFVALSATTWGMGYSWPRVQGLLEQLIEEEVLQRDIPKPSSKTC